MTEDLEDKLVRAFPNLYRDVKCSDPTQSCMYWGIEVGDGWYNLLWKLSEKLEQEILKYKASDWDEDPDSLPMASQIKEKYGTLRVYMSHSSDAMDLLIDEAESESEVTCERC